MAALNYKHKLIWNTFILFMCPIYVIYKYIHVFLSASYLQANILIIISYYMHSEFDRNRWHQKKHQLREPEYQKYMIYIFQNNFITKCNSYVELYIYIYIYKNIYLKQNIYILYIYIWIMNYYNGNINWAQFVSPIYS